MVDLGKQSAGRFLISFSIASVFWMPIWVQAEEATAAKTATESTKIDSNQKQNKVTENLSITHKDLLFILDEKRKYPTQTTEALNRLLSYPADMRESILNWKLPLGSVFMQAYLSLNSLDADMNHTPLPQSLKHTLIGKVLAQDIAKFLGDPTITLDKLWSLSDEHLEKVLDHTELWERHDNWTKEELRLAQAENAAAKAENAAADQRLAAAKAENAAAKAENAAAIRTSVNLQYIAKMLGVKSE